MTIRKRTDYIVLHVTATRPLTPAGVAEVTKMHKARGFSTIGYHYIVRLNGKVEAGRPENQIGAHVQGFNSVSIGVSLEGGLSQTTGKPADTRTPAQIEALIDLLKDLTKRYPNARICGHRDLSPDRDGDGVVEPYEYLKECPCFDAIPWAAQNGLPAATIKGTWSSGSVANAGTKTNPGPDSKDVANQKLLKQAGYEFGPLDGIVGRKTKAALVRYQKAAGLKETGAFDAATVAKLKALVVKPLAAAIAKDDTLKIIPPAVPATVKELAAKGSATIATATAGQAVAIGGAISGAIASANETIKVVQQVQSTARDFQDVAEKVLAVWPSVALLVVAGGAFLFLKRIKSIRVAEHNNGTNIGLREPVEFLRLTDADLKVE